MDDNSHQPRTRCTGWLVWSGIATLMLAGLCFSATLIGMVRSYHSISTSPTAPKPADLALGISNSLIPAQTVFPLVVVGTILITAGFIRSQSVPNK